MTHPTIRALKGDVLRTRAEMGTRSLVMNGEIMIYGIIDSFDDYGIRALDVMGSIMELVREPRLSVRINSPGGSVMEGLSIFNALRNAGKPVDVHIDAMAASIASIIAMAGETIAISEAGTLMVHNPWDYVVGGSDDLRARADEIDRLKAIMVDIYQARTGLTPEHLDALMTAETFMGAVEAVDLGFADSVELGLAIAACARLSATDLRRLNETVSARAPSKPIGLAAAIKARMIMRARAVKAGLDPFSERRDQ